MSVPVQNPINQIVIVGGETLIPWTWNLQKEGEITVLVQRASTGLVDTLTLSADYTVDANGLDNDNGGNITPIGSESPVTAGDIWTLFRVTAIDRSPDFAVGGAFFASTINEQLDELTRITQEANRDVANAVRKDPGVGDVLNPLIPQPVDERALKFRDAGGGNFEMVMSDNDPDQQVNDAANSAAAALVSEQAAALSETNASTSEGNAATSETNAGNSEIAAALSETNALDSENNAATSATAASDQLEGTSVTPLTIGTGTKVFITQANKFFEAGVSLKITSNANPTNFMFGDVTSYSGTTLTMNITVIGGSGTFSDWTIRLSGLEGPEGSTVFANQLLHIQDQKTFNNSGGSFIAGDYETRDLNTVLTNEIIGASLASNQITLPIGTYYLEASAPALKVSAHRIKVRDTTGAADLLIGTNTRSENVTSGTQTRSFVEGRFPLSAESIIEIQHRCNVDNLTNGFGNLVNYSSEPEVYTDVKIWRIS